MQLFEDDGTLLFEGAVDLDDVSQFIKHSPATTNSPARLQVNVTEASVVDNRPKRHSAPPQ